MRPVRFINEQIFFKFPILNCEIFKLSCALNEVNDKYALSAIQRASTQDCKTKFLNSACYFKTINSLDYAFAYKRLATKCPLIDLVKTYTPIGHIDENQFQSLVSQPHLFIYNKDQKYINKEICIDYCLSHTAYFFVIFQSNTSGENDCFCIQSLDGINALFEKSHQQKYLIYETGACNFKIEII